MRLAPNRRTMTIVRTEGGALVERFEDEQVGVAEQERRLVAARQAREAERAPEAEAVHRHEQALREQLRRELPEHLRRLMP